MKISICSVTYNRKETVKKWLTNLISSLNKDFEYEIFIHDNNSKDGTKDLLTEFNDIHKFVNIEFCDNNIGKPKALNNLFKKCSGNYFVSSDSDIIVPINWTGRLIETFNDYEKIGLVSPIYKDNGNSPLMGTDLETVNSSDRKVFFFGKDLKYNVAGGFIMLDPIAFNSIGGYKENGLYGGNDAVLNINLKKNGYKCAYTKNVVVEHIMPLDNELGYENWKKSVNTHKKENMDYQPSKGYWD